MWDALDREFDLWREAGLTATFWWRDDDAAACTPALDRLFAVSAHHGVAPAIAVIPAAMDGSLECPDGGAAVLQHGYAHRNHAAPGEKKCELCAGRPRNEVLGELSDGRDRLAAAFGHGFLPVLVPPWNRIDGALEDALPSLGFTGLSTFAPRRAAHPVAPLQANAHIDIVDWHGGRGFCGNGAALRQAIGHLAARRTGTVDRGEPTGLLTHHLAHDDACWRFVDEFLDRSRRHAAVRWLGPRDIFV